MRIEPSAIFVVNEVTEQTAQRLKAFLEAGGKVVVLSAKLAQGVAPYEVPADVTVIDLRYGNGMNLVRGRHPRIEGYWPQYSGLRTGLARNIVVSQAISNETPIEDARSQPHEAQLAPYGTPLSSEDYRHLHNHHQNLLVETFNFSPDLNAVSIWGDSAALVPGAKSWGAFVSARSWPLKWDAYTPANTDGYDNAHFDAQLVGLEIDVLNAGLDWGKKSPMLASPMAKVGVQIVGFGSRNTAAIEIRTEDTDDAARGPRDRRGAWYWGIIIRNALSEQSTVLMSENGRIKRGIDFDLTSFTEGALRILGAGDRSGIMFDGGTGGQIYAEPSAAGPVLCIRAGQGGLKFLSEDGSTILPPQATEAHVAPKPALPLDVRSAAASVIFANAASSSQVEAQRRQAAFADRLTQGHRSLEQVMQRMSGAFAARLAGPRGGRPFFIHIPKCAGSSVDYVLEINYIGQKSYVGSGDLDQLEALKQKPPQGDFAYLTGHLPFGTHLHFGADFVPFSVLREPKGRLLSEYHYITATGRDAYSAGLRARDVSIEQFLQELQGWQCNPQVKYLCGVHPVEVVDEWDALMTACENLIEHCWLAAPIDGLPVLLVLCARRFGWRLLSNQARNVCSPKVAGLAAVLDKACKPYVFADEVLFEIVKTAWDAALSALPASGWAAVSDWTASREGILDLREPAARGGALHQALFDFACA
ncbi:MAG: hypothetical protein AAGC69_09225 [Paracraurococcus sp.]